LVDVISPVAADIGTHKFRVKASITANPSIFLEVEFLVLEIVCEIDSVTVSPSTTSPTSYFLNDVMIPIPLAVLTLPAICPTTVTLVISSATSSTFATLTGSSGSETVELYGTDGSQIGAHSYTVTPTATNAAALVNYAPWSFSMDVQYDCSTTAIIGNSQVSLVVDYSIAGVAETRDLDKVYTNTIADFTADSAYCGAYNFELRAEDPNAPGTYLAMLPGFITFDPVLGASHISVSTSDILQINSHYFDLVVSMTDHPTVTHTITRFLQVNIACNFSFDWSPATLTALNG